MCGIVAYVGHREACPLVIKGLKRLEYRGYDSAGVALMNGEGLKVYKKKGKVAALEAELTGREPQATIGMGHTRWATHGEPTRTRITRSTANWLSFTTASSRTTRPSSRRCSKKATPSRAKPIPKSWGSSLRTSGRTARAGRSKKPCGWPFRKSWVPMPS